MNVDIRAPEHSGLGGSGGASTTVGEQAAVQGDSKAQEDPWATLTTSLGAATGVQSTISGVTQLAHRLSALKKGSTELKLITAVDAVAFALVTVLGGLVLMYLISFNTIVYVTYQQRGQKVPSLVMGNNVESNLINSLLMLVQVVEDADSMLIELIHLYPTIKHLGWMSAAYGENPEEWPNKFERALYLLDIASSVIQLVSGIIMSVDSLVEAQKELKKTLDEANSPPST